MRGKVDFYYFYTPDRRITPACAGKREQRGSNSQWLKDHPRVCGEKVLLRLKHSRKLGSPPRVRGKAKLCDSVVLLSGITPACAGKRSRPEYCNGRNQDHPRVCGEKDLQNAVLGGNLGSPPRVRGKEEDEHAKGQAHGITPACAGKRRPKVWQTSTRWDHPRVCGEKK